MAKNETQLKPIVVVDDDPLFTKMIETELGKKGFKTITFHSGQELLKLLQESQAPKVLILDLGLGDVPGIVLLPKVKEAWPQTKILVYTGLEEKHHEFLDVIRHADSFLKKSDDISRLSAIVQEFFFEPVPPSKSSR